MEHTFEELKKKTVNDLREIAKGIEGVTGYSQLNKEHLLVTICKALHIEMHAHHEVVGIDKTAVKAKIKELKKTRDEAMAKKDKALLKDLQHRIHMYKRKLHKCTV